jgi:UDP-4-amino-4,6-dideoxy-N-acetyl-beta-L-altrosamine transaminase
MNSHLRIAPAPERPLPYGRHDIDQSDVDAVTAALTSGCLAHGPRVGAFERAFANRVGAREAVACSSGTAALHLALAALDVGEDDICIVPAVTFLATASAARFCGAEVVFADVDPASGLMTSRTLAAAIRRAGRPVKAVLPVHLGGRICDVAALAHVAKGSAVVEDACHALGGVDADGDAVGGCAASDAACFSFHPVKTIAAGEGGMVALGDPDRAERMRRLRNHGVSREPALLRDADLSLDAGGEPNPWSYEQVELGFNYRMNEMEAALGLNQLGRLDRFVARRQALAGLYDRRLAELAHVTPIRGAAGDLPSLHLYQVCIDFEATGRSRAEVMRALSTVGVQTQVHYIPLYRQPYFRGRYGDMRLPGAEAFYAGVLALPLFPAMEDADVERVCDALETALA